MDERDSLFNSLNEKKVKWKGKTATIGELSDRENEAAKVLIWVVNELMHMMEKEIGKNLLLTFNSSNIIYGPDGVIMIGLQPKGSKEMLDEGVEEGNMKGEKNVVGGDSELHRWKAPVLLRGNVKEAIESTHPFTIGLILYEMWTNKQPFQDKDGMSAWMKMCDDMRPNPTLFITQGMIDHLLAACWKKDGEKRENLE